MFDEFGNKIGFDMFMDEPVEAVEETVEPVAQSINHLPEHLQEQYLNKIERAEHIDKLKGREQSENTVKAMYPNEFEKPSEATVEPVSDTPEPTDDKSNRNVPLMDVKIPLSTNKDTMDNVTNTIYKTYTVLMMNSYNGRLKGMDGQNYLYKDKISEVIEEYGISQRTLDTHVKKLNKLQIPLVDIVNTPNGIAYKLNFATDKVVKKDAEGNETVEDIDTKRYFTKIPYEILEDLVGFVGEKVLKLYVILNYRLETDRYKQMDRYHLAEQIGMSPKANKNLAKVGKKLEGLHYLGLIEIRTSTKSIWDDTKKCYDTKTYNHYRLRSLEEYRALKLERKPRKLEPTDKVI